MRHDDKIAVGNSMKDGIEPRPEFKIDREILKPLVESLCLTMTTGKDSKLDIYGSEKGFKKIPESEFAENETHTLRSADCIKVTGAYADSYGGKGVVVQVIPNDQLPIDTEGNKAELLIPERRLPGLGGDHDYDMLHHFPSHAVIPFYAKPKPHINRQRQGYSRRKAKRVYQARAAYKVKLRSKAYRRPPSYLLLVDENGNLVSTKNDQFAGVAKEHLSRLTMKNEFNFDNFVLTDKGKHYFDTQTAVDSFTQLTKPNPDGKSDFNGA